MSFQQLDYSLTLGNGAVVTFLDDTSGFLAIQIEVSGSTLQLPISQAEARKFVQLGLSVTQSMTQLKGQ